MSPFCYSIAMRIQANPPVLWRPASLLLSALLLMQPVAAFADLFQVRDQNPLLLGFGLPFASSTELPKLDHWAVSIAHTRSNTLNDERSDGEHLVLDGEVGLSTLSVFYGVDKDWSVGLVVPVISHGGGGLDRLIVDFHDRFNFPNGARKRVPDNQLNYSYMRNDQAVLAYDQSGASLGDVALLLGYQWVAEGRDQAALYAQFKLPTGDPDKLSGNGEFDYANWFTARRSLGGNWMVQGAFGLALLGNSNHPIPNYNHVFFGALGLDWTPVNRLSLRVQFDYHGKVFRGTKLDLLGPVVSVTSGVAVQLSSRTTLDLAVVEDALVNASPDVQFHMGLHHRFGGKP